MKILANNRKAYADYEVLDKMEVGVKLLGWEVKSVKNGSVNLKDGFIKINNSEAWLCNINISRWKTQSAKEYIDTFRERKLLLHRSEIDKLTTRIMDSGLTIVPLQLYLANNDKIKVELAVVKGKKKYDKRQKLKEQDQIRQMQRDLKQMGY
jgi:SsrA-binding protein